MNKIGNKAHLTVSFQVLIKFTSAIVLEPHNDQTEAYKKPETKTMNC